MVEVASQLSGVCRFLCLRKAHLHAHIGSKSFYKTITSLNGNSTKVPLVRESPPLFPPEIDFVTPLSPLLCFKINFGILLIPHKAITSHSNNPPKQKPQKPQKPSGSLNNGKAHFLGR